MKIKKISYKTKVLALILKADAKIKGVEFFTPKDYPFQLGAQLKEKGAEIKPHIHRPRPRAAMQTQEMIHIDHGKVRADFYSEKGEKVSSAILNSGDTVLLVSGGHGFKILEKTKIIEVKQGPYVEGLDKLLLGD